MQGPKGSAQGQWAQRAHENPVAHGPMNIVVLKGLPTWALFGVV